MKKYFAIVKTELIQKVEIPQDIKERENWEIEDYLTDNNLWPDFDFSDLVCEVIETKEIETIEKEFNF